MPIVTQPALHAALAFMLFALAGVHAEEKPRPAQAVRQDAEWLVAIDRLRSQPEPGELDSGPYNNAPLADVLKLGDEHKAKIAAVLEAYNADRMKKAAEWEEQLKALRAQHEAKLLETLPAEVREKSKQLLEIAHSKWVSSTEREHQFRTGFMKERERFKDVDPKNKEKMDEARETLQAWTKAERARNGRIDTEAVNALRALLTPEEAERLETHNRQRQAAPNQQPQPQPPQPQPEKK